MSPVLVDGVPDFSVKYCRENDQADIVGFLTAADLAVTGIQIVEKDFSPDMLLGICPRN